MNTASGCFIVTVISCGPVLAIDVTLPNSSDSFVPSVGVPLQAPQHVVGGHRRAVVEGDVVAQGQHERGRVVHSYFAAEDGPTDMSGWSW